MTNIPNAKELMAKIAKVEGEKASKAMKAHEAAEAEKQELLDRLTRPSGLSDDEVMEKAAVIVNRAVENGMTSVQVFRFPNHVCTDNGRAINQAE
jgi:alcohol dehydrogenase class IV